MKKILTQHIINLIFLFLMGCGTVTTEYLVGQLINEDLSSQLTGVWQSDSLVYYITQIDVGIIKFANVRWDGKKYVLDQRDAYLTVLNDNYYINVIESKRNKQKPKYSFGQYKIVSDNEIIIYPAHTGFFIKSVHEGTLKGAIVKKGTQNEIVKITEEKDAFLKFIEKGESDKLFDTKNPIKLRRKNR